MTGEAWDLTRHVRGVMSEALVAEAVHRRHPDAVLHRPRHPGYDVSSQQGAVRVDAKVATILNVNLDGAAEVEAIEWDAGARENLLHKTATHLGLVALDEAITTLHLSDSDDVILRGTAIAHGRVFLVPAEVANSAAKPIWNIRDCCPSKGRYRYIPLDLIAHHEVEFNRYITPRGRK